MPSLPSLRAPLQATTGLQCPGRVSAFATRRVMRKAAITPGFAAHAHRAAPNRLRRSGSTVQREGWAGSRHTRGTRATPFQRKNRTILRPGGRGACSLGHPARPAPLIRRVLDLGPLHGTWCSHSRTVRAVSSRPVKRSPLRAIQEIRSNRAMDNRPLKRPGDLGAPWLRDIPYRAAQGRSRRPIGNWKGGFEARSAARNIPGIVANGQATPSDGGQLNAVAGEAVVSGRLTGGSIPAIRRSCGDARQIQAKCRGASRCASAKESCTKIVR